MFATWLLALRIGASTSSTSRGGSVRPRRAGLPRVVGRNGDTTRRRARRGARLDLGPSARDLHRRPQPGQGRGPALRGDAGPGAHGSPAADALVSIYLAQAVGLWFISLPVQVAMFEQRDVGVLTWLGARCGWSGSSSRVSATGSCTRSKPIRERRPGDGPRVVALHPPPQLLRRRDDVVGPVPDRRASSSPARSPSSRRY